MLIMFIGLVILIPTMLVYIVPGQTMDEKIEYLESKLKELEDED